MIIRRQFLFFDLGWTLEDETKAQMDRARKTAKELAAIGIQVTTEDILSKQEEGARLMAPSVYRYVLQSYGLDEAAVDDVQNKVGWNKQLLGLYSSVTETLMILNKQHYLGLIANQSPGTEGRLQSYGIRHFFKLVFASAELGLSKPNLRIFALAERSARCKPVDAWMIGDRLDNDIAPANRAGWNTIRILQGYNRFQKPKAVEEEPDFTVTEIKAVVSIVNSQASMPRPKKK